jgi:hypothetical protein
MGAPSAKARDRDRVPTLAWEFRDEWVDCLEGVRDPARDPDVSPLTGGEIFGALLSE